MSAPRALGTSSPPSPTATSRPTASGTDPVRVRIAGPNRTFEVREVLRGMGLRWDPLSHAWHGSLPPAARVRVERDLGLSVQLVPPLDSFPAAPEPPAAPAVPVRLRGARDGSRSRLEARIALPDESEKGAGPANSRFTLLDVTSGLPDDSREADERAAARSLRDLRARVKAARALVAKTPDLSEILTRDPASAAWFCARFRIMADQLPRGVPSVESCPEDSRPVAGFAPADCRPEVRAREGATLPEVGPA